MVNKEKVSFLNLPTPLERLEGISKDLDVNFYIKRDDLTVVGMGGNKLRKLEYFLKDALNKKATMLLTIGGAETNHGRLTAAVAAKYKLKCVIVTTDKYHGELSANLLLDRLMGATVIFEKTPTQVIKEYEAKGETVYFIPMGGSSPLGCLGYYECASELTNQTKAMGISDARVFVGVGSMGTYMGLYTGLLDIDSPLKLTGIAIAPYENGTIEYAKEYFQKVREYHNLDLKAKAFHITDDYTYGGYNNPVSKVRQAICHMARREAIILDPCYTGKVFNGICKMVEKGEIKKGENIIFIHTGGMPGIYGLNHRIEFEKELIDGIIY